MILSIYLYSIYKSMHIKSVSLTDVVHGAGAEPGVEVLGAQGLEVFDHPGPQVQHVVPDITIIGHFPTNPHVCLLVGWLVRRMAGWLLHWLVCLLVGLS